MRKNDPIKHVMSDNIHAVQQGQAVSDVFSLVHENNIHHVPVLDGKKLVGIVSSTDLMKLSVGTQNYDSSGLWAYLDTQYEIIDIMTADPKTLHVSGTVRDAAEALSNGSYHSLPVTNDERQLVGMVTSTDLIRYLSDQY